MAHRQVTVSCVLQFCLTILLLAARVAADEFDDEFEGLHVGTEQAQTQPAPEPAPKHHPKMNTGRVTGFRIKYPTNYVPEALVVFALVAFIVNFWLGKRFNSRMALAFTGWACKQGGVLQRNFELVGLGKTARKQILLRQTPNNYLVWASGRRCACHLALHAWPANMRASRRVGLQSSLMHVLYGGAACVGWRQQ